jgi:hypothetical protein
MELLDTKTYLKINCNKLHYDKIKRGKASEIL